MQVTQTAVKREIRIDPELKALLDPLSSDEFEQLRANVLAEGVRDPLVVWDEENILLDGHHRYRICEAAGLDYPTERISLPSRDAAKRWMIKNQLGKRNLTREQQAYYRGKLYNELKKDGFRGNQHTSAKDQNDTKQNTAQEIAEQTGVGEATVKRDAKYAESVDRLAESGVDRSDLTGKNKRFTKKDTVTLAEMDEDERTDTLTRIERGEAKSVKDAKKARRREEREAAVKEAEKEPPALDELTQRYSIIYADPPWRYDFSRTDNRRIENHYSTLSLGELCDLPVPGITTEDALLFLWTTTAKIPEALRVIEAWGFQYKTSFCWVKDKIGMGYYCRNQHELLFVAKRGAIPPPKPENRVSSVFEAPRTKHSRKPVRAYEIIDSMYPDNSKIELFARTSRDGWDAWGAMSNE